ncbi:hypothetical protein NUJ47_10640, partial [Mycobacterium sp. XDR-29]|nr:hypothetical protein [Mycobacterium sp. XDR-29]
MAFGDGGTTMMVAPGIAARVAARLATTPGGKPGGRPGMADPAAAAGTAGVCWAAGLVAVSYTHL